MSALAHGITVAGLKVWSLHEENILTTLEPTAQSATSGSGVTIVGGGAGEGPGPDVMRAATLDGDKVIISDGKDVEKIPFRRNAFQRYFSCVGKDAAEP